MPEAQKYSQASYVALLSALYAIFNIVSGHNVEYGIKGRQQDAKYSKSFGCTPKSIHPVLMHCSSTCWIYTTAASRLYPGPL